MSDDVNPRDSIIDRLLRESAEEQRRDPTAGHPVPAAYPADSTRQHVLRVGICGHCGHHIKLVPGGEGPTWVHEDGYRPCDPAHVIR